MSLENKSNGILINENELLEFAKNASPVDWPNDNFVRRKILVRNFRNSCVMVKISGKGYKVGELNWTDAVGYSMTVNGEEMRASYSETEAIFKPKLC